VSDYTAEEISGLFTRRFKKDIEDQVAGHFQERSVRLEKVSASPAEEAVFTALADLHLASLHRSGIQDALFRIGLLKAFLSSPIACLQTVKGRLRRIEQQLASLDGSASKELDDRGADWAADLDEEEAQQALFEEGDKSYQRVTALQSDRHTLRTLQDRLLAVELPSFSKYGRLLHLLRSLNAVGSARGERIIIFSERIATLHFLQEKLCRDLGADERSVAIFHAGLPDVDQQAIVDSFGKADSPIRILLASDVASEGVNLHYYCHLMIHFDIPWSLITLEQRNGRIDRYGQSHEPLIHYLLTLSEQEGIKADLRVLERLIEKEEEAHKNIGDAATILGLHDAAKEEERIAAGLASGEAITEIIPDQSPEQDWLAILMGGAESVASSEDLRGATLSLYRDDLDFARAGFAELLEAGFLERAPDYHPERPAFELLAPQDLRRRCEFLPQEATPDGWIFHLTTDRARVMAAIAEARRTEGEWPRTQLFWELHPVMDWLLDRLLVCFGRHEAPVLVAHGAMDPEEFILLFQGVLSNRRSQPLVAEWFGIAHDRSGLSPGPWPLEEVLGFTNFDRGLANRGQPSRNQERIAALLPQAVDLARQQMDRLRLARGQELLSRLKDDQRKLQRWHRSTLARLQQQRADAIGARAASLEHELHETEALYQQRQQWLAETFTADPAPYLRLAAVFSGS
jgi:hypothetical protein